MKKTVGIDRSNKAFNKGGTTLSSEIPVYQPTNYGLPDCNRINFVKGNLN